MITQEKLKEAVDCLNAAKCDKLGENKDLLNTKIVLGEDHNANIETFLLACESVPEDIENYIPNSVADVYNTIKDELEALELEKSTKVEPVVPKKVNSKPPKVAGEETRPAMLKRKMLEHSDDVKLEDLYKDAELMAKFENHKSWIKINFEKMIAEKK